MFRCGRASSCRSGQRATGRDRDFHRQRRRRTASYPLSDFPRWPRPMRCAIAVWTDADSGERGRSAGIDARSGARPRSSAARTSCVAPDARRRDAVQTIRRILWPHRIGAASLGARGASDSNRSLPLDAPWRFRGVPAKSERRYTDQCCGPGLDATRLARKCFASFDPGGTRSPGSRRLQLVCAWSAGLRAASRLAEQARQTSSGSRAANTRKASGDRFAG